MQRDLAQHAAAHDIERMPTTFIITLVTSDDRRPHRRLAQVLKVALRAHGLRCTDVKEVHDTSELNAEIGSTELDVSARS